MWYLIPNKIKNLILNSLKVFFIALLLVSILELGKKYNQKEKIKQDQVSKNLIKILDKKNLKLEKEILEKVSQLNN